MATTGFWPVKDRLKEVIDYAENPDKTIDKKYVDSDLLVLCQEKVQVKSELFLQPSIFYPANLSILFNFCSYTFSYSFGDRYPQ